MNLRLANPGLRIWLLIFAITFLAAGLRLWGITFGAPHLYHPDEIKLAQAAIHLAGAIAREGPADFSNPLGAYPPLFSYLLAGLYLLSGSVETLLGSHTSLLDYLATYWSSPFPFHLLGRALSALMGIATIPLLYCSGAILYDRRTGALAASFLAFTYIHVRNSHYCTADIPATFFTLAAFTFLALIHTRGRMIHYLAAGLLIGLAAATKYNTALLLAPLLLAHGLRRHTFFHPRLGLALAASLGGFLLGCPRSLLDSYHYLLHYQPSTFLQGVGELFEVQRQGKPGGILWGDGFWSYITGEQWSGFGFVDRNSMRAAMGLPQMLLALGGVLAAALGSLRNSTHRGRDWLTLSFPVALYCLLGSMEYKAMRHLLPAMPLLSLLAARFLLFLIARARELAGPRLHRLWLPATAALILIVLGPMIRDAIALDHRLALKESRTIAREWVLDHIPPHSRVGVEHYPPQSLPFEVFEIFKNRTPDEIVDASRRIEEERFDYVILDNWSHDRWLNDRAMDRSPRITTLYRRFLQHVEESFECLTVVNGKRPEDPAISGPTIKVYRRRASSRQTITAHAEGG